MVPSRWSSLDGLKAYQSQQGASFIFLERLRIKHTELGTKPEVLFKLFSTASTLRATFLFLAWEYAKISDKNEYRVLARNIFDWLDGILSAGMLEDKWVLAKNLIHTSEEVAGTLTDTPWIEENLQAVKDAGKMYVSAASIGFALYRDFFPQEAHEAYGPYDASERFGPDTTLVVKHFPKLKPVELWPEVKNFPYEEVTIYQILKGVHFRCELIGMHSLYDGPSVPNTAAIAVKVDGRFLPEDEIAKVAMDIAKHATEYSHLYEKLTLHEAKLKFVEWETYQFNRLFEAAGMDWRPTDGLLAPVMANDIPMGISIDSWPVYEEFVSSKEYEVFWLQDLYK